jgi:hypothetical protein
MARGLASLGKRLAALLLFGLCERGLRVRGRLELVPSGREPDADPDARLSEAMEG